MKHYLSLASQTCPAGFLTVLKRWMMHRNNVSIIRVVFIDLCLQGSDTSMEHYVDDLNVRNITVSVGVSSVPLCNDRTSFNKRVLALASHLLTLWDNSKFHAELLKI